MSGDADVGPMARLEEVKRDANAPSVVFQRLTAEVPETLPQIAKSWGCPKGRFVEWFTTEHAEMYDAALKVVAADQAIQALEISDGAPRQAVSPDGAPLFDDAGNPVLVEPDVARDKLRTATRQWFAARYDRPRFGERADVKVQVEDNRVPVDRDALILETARRLAYIMHAAARQAPMPMLLAPIENQKREEKIVSDPGII